MNFREEINRLYQGDENVYFRACFYTGMSALFDRTQIFYPDAQHLHLYVCFLGCAGAKKGVVSEVKKIFRSYQEELLNAYKEKGDSKAPLRLFFLPANTSTSALIQCISNSQGSGIIWESEIETLSNMLSTDYGNFSDVLRNNFHEETISLCRRKENEYIECLSPHISVILAGTYLQAKNLFNGGENGLFSRFLFFNLKEKQKWLNLFCETNERDRFYKNMGDFSKYLLENSFFIERVHFSDEQKKEHYSTFESIHNSINRDFLFAVNKRKALIFLRLAAIISIINHIEKGNLKGDIYCDMEAWEEAKEIISYADSEVAMDKMKGESENETERKRNKIFYDLPAHFTIENMGSEISLATKYRYISKWLKSEMIEKDKNVYIKL